MGFTMPPIPGIIGIVCAGVGLLFQIVGVATPGWVDLNGSNSGLWQACVGGSCFNFNDLGEFA